MNLRRLFVGNLPFKIKEEELKKFFEKVGSVVDVKIVTYKNSRRSKGFAFVEMETIELAEKAMKSLHESEFGGRPIRIHPASEKKLERETLQASG